eukprot:tig00021348_g20520.t1
MKSFGILAQSPAAAAANAVTSGFVCAAYSLPTIVSHGLGTRGSGASLSISFCGLKGPRPGHQRRSAARQQVPSSLCGSRARPRSSFVSCTWSSSDSEEKPKDATGVSESRQLTRPFLWREALKSAFPGKQGEALVDVSEAFMQHFDERFTKLEERIDRKFEHIGLLILALALFLALCN